MVNLTEDLYRFFNLTIGGFEICLSEYQLKNKPLIIKIFECLEKEQSFTNRDIQHLRAFKLLVNLIEIPEFTDIKSLISLENYLKKSILILTENQVVL
jgi:hypothetical protein